MRPTGAAHAVEARRRHAVALALTLADIVWGLFTVGVMSR